MVDIQKKIINYGNDIAYKNYKKLLTEIDESRERNDDIEEKRRIWLHQITSLDT